MKKLFSLFAAVLFAGSMMAGTYTKTAYADLQNGDVVIITELVGTNVYAASNDNGTSAAPTAVSVTVANDAITTDATNILWTVVKDGANISFKTGDNYLYCTNTNNGMRVGSNSNNVFSIDANSGYLYNNGTSRFIGVYNSSDWRCYTSVNANIKDQTLAFYAVGGSTPSEPVVEYYLVGTMNEWTPATGYKFAANGANAGEYMLKTTFAANDQFKVRKVVDGEADAWYPDGMDNNYTITEAGKYNVYFRPDGQGGEGWHEGCIYAARILPKTCAEVYSMAKDDEVLLNNVTVTFANGKNVWVKDATGSMLVYLPANGSFVAGDVLSGVEGVVDIYNGIYEVKLNAAQVEAITATAGEAPAPEELTAVATTDMNKYIVLKNLAVEGEFVEGTVSNITLTLADESTIVLRSNFKNAYAFDAAKTYNITAVVTIYQSNPQLYFISAEEYEEPVVPADRRINAYGLNVVANGDDYVFSYYANINGNEANLLFYKDGALKGRVAVDAPEQGVNDVTLAKSEIPEGTGLTWAVELKANPVTEFAKIAEGDDLKKCHLAIDNSPESDYFGRMYVANRAGSGSGGIYIYNQDFTVKTSNTLAGQPKWQSMGRPSVADDGTVYIGDWGDSHGGVYVMNPATETATCLFDGTQNSSTGLWTNAAGTAMGSSTASVGVYGSGENTVLYAMNEDASTAGTTLYAHGANVYQLGQADGSVLSTWNVAPTKTFAVLDHDAQMFVINATSKGAFFSCSRSEGNNAAGARSLQFYNTNGQRTYVALPEGATADLTGSLGGGSAVSRDEKVLAIVDGSGNILVYNVAWNVDTPSLTLATKYTTEFAALGSLCFDYAGNIVVTAGANYNNNTANKLVAYGVPTDKNEIIVPAKKALVVEGTDPNPSTAIEDIYVLEVQKVIRNGQVLIIKDGKTYNMMGQIVE